MDEKALESCERFFHMYTLRYLEAHSTSDLILQISVATLRYGMSAVRTGGGPAAPALEGEAVEPAARMRRAVFPRWRALLDEADPFAPLGLNWDENLRLRAGLPELERYRERRHLDTSLAGYLQHQPAAPATRIPVVASAPQPLAPDASALETRLAQIQRILEVIDTLIRTVGTFVGFVNDWRERRKQRALLDVQRELLQAALSQNLAGADEALRLAGEPGYVAGYLAEHTDDEIAGG